MKTFKAIAFIILAVSGITQAAVDPVAQCAQIGNAFSTFAKLLELTQRAEQNQVVEPAIVQCAGCKEPVVRFGELPVLLLCKAYAVIEKADNGLNALITMQPLLERYVALAETGTNQEKQVFALDVCREMAYVCDRCQSSLLEPIPA